MSCFAVLVCSDVTISADDAESAYQSLCALNELNEVKYHDDDTPVSADITGPHPSMNFYGVAWDYSIRYKSLREILEAMGYKFYTQWDGSISFLGGYLKIGQGELFLEALAPYIKDGFMTFYSEDDTMYYVEFNDGIMTLQKSEIHWKPQPSSSAQLYVRDALNSTR